MRDWTTASKSATDKQEPICDEFALDTINRDLTRMYFAESCVLEIFLLKELKKSLFSFDAWFPTDRFKNTIRS